MEKSSDLELPSSLPKSPFPRPSPQGTPEARPSPILRRRSSTSQSRAALRSAWLRDAPAGQPRCAGRWRGGVSEAWPAAGGVGRCRGGGAKRPFEFPIRSIFPNRSRQDQAGHFR